MPEKVPLSSANMNQNGESRHSSDQQQFRPYNEKISNTVNASIASAMGGRGVRTQVAASSSFPRGIHPTGKPNDVSKALDSVRATLQKFINQELHASMQKFVKEYFEPAMENIRSNYGADAVTDAHVSSLFCKILDEAKEMYEPAPAATPLVNTTAFDVDQLQEPFARYGQSQRRGSDDSYTSASSSVKRQKIERKKQAPVRKPGDKASPAGEDFNSRDSKNIHTINETTKFILGASANKILGYAAARGRIYVKYPNLFKYVGDQEDKQWLFENRIMTAAGGKAFLVLAEDVREILILNENPRDLVSETVNFTIPPFMLEKMRSAAHHFINSDTRSRSGSNVSNISHESRVLTDEEDLEPIVHTPPSTSPPSTSPPSTSPPSTSPPEFLGNLGNQVDRIDLFATSPTQNDSFYDNLNLLDHTDEFSW